MGKSKRPDVAGKSSPAAPVAAGVGGELPRRDYGRHGVKLSVIGFGGILVMNAEQAQADRAVARAVERGVNYFDVAPTYGDAEIKLGPALEPYRKEVFLACKTTERLRGPAEAEMKRSMERLRTDHFDLYQLHGLTELAEVETAFEPGGVMELLMAAKRDGRVRHVGFSAHSEEAALAAMERYEFDSTLFPVNFNCWFKGHFGSRVVERAARQGVSILALKALARQRWPKNDAAVEEQKKRYGKCWYQPLIDPAEAELALRFTLSQPVTAALTPGEEEFFWRALDMASRFRPITPAEEEQLRALAEGLIVIFPKPGA